MKTRFVRFVLAAGLALLPLVLQAQSSAHYVPGVEGIKAATLPPPGVYFRDYNYFYTADQLNDASGNKIGPADLDAFVYANLPRILWITDQKFLGGYMGLDGFLPLVYQQASANTPGGHFSGNRFGVGDLFAEGTLSWHLKQFDFSVGSGVDLPTGDSPTSPGPSAKPGLGYWTFMQTAGATWYIDRKKTWAVSALNRLEFNTSQRNTDITYGDAYTLEWGVSKTLAKVVDLGGVGYYQQQFTGDSNGQPLNRVAAVGPEVNGLPESDALRLAPLRLRVHGRIPRAGPHLHAHLDEAFLGVSPWGPRQRGFGVRKGNRVQPPYVGSCDFPAREKFLQPRGCKLSAIRRVCRVEVSENIQCPFCGQAFEMVVDTSVSFQRFTTDCEICCRPFEVMAECEPGEILSLDAVAN